MDATGGHHVKWSKPGSEGQRPHVFSHTWKIDPKDKSAQKQAWSHTNSYVERVCNSGNYSMELGEREKEKENDRASVIP
jgi:hypothetical protein